MQRSHQIILGLSITLLAGYTWSLDMPQALEVPLRQKPFDFSNFDFSLLYFATYIPVCFFDISIGMVLDKVPFKKAAVWITSICLLSEIGILLSFYLQFDGYKTALYILRGVFGATGSGLLAVQALLITRYGGKYYDTLIGIGVCIPFFFDSINNIITPLIYDLTSSMELVWLIGVGFCVLAVVSSIIIKRFVDKQDECQLPKQQITQQEEEDEGFSFKGVRMMKKQFWVLMGAILFFQLCIASYIDNLNDTLVKRFQFSYATAGYFLFIPYGMAAICCYFIGKVLSVNSKLKRKIIVLGAFLFNIGILLSYFLPNINQDEETPLYYYVFVEVQFITISFMMAILYGCLSSSIKYVVDEKYLGVGWGIIGSTVGLSEALGPIIAGSVLETSSNLADGYKRLALVIFGISVFAVEFGLWIYFGQFEQIDTVSSQCLPSLDLSDSLLDKQTLSNLSNTETTDSVFT